ncbi:ligand-effect modulator 3 family [Corynascus novoguineensis]|uniref:Ligand-effect modulator 3 family n=1 Tax=Corynascus novoguineensis TaxID=1126955 RepID=A0AAN7CVH9_9PEZI|nr:ligand-effect modulator 3 family [Corynascus novoguineensis]
MAFRRRRGAANDAGDDAASETDMHKNRPPNTAFRQQRMRAWQCVLTPKLIVTIFSILAAIYLGFGAWLTYLAYTVRDIRIDYTNCQKEATGKFEPMPAEYITAHFSTTDGSYNPYEAEWMKETLQIQGPGFLDDRDYCRIKFNIPEELQPTISFFYNLENFYQNHRRYVNSFNAKQLLGDAVDGRTINDSTCDPITHDWEGTGKIVYPCGLVANSVFNDTFSSPVLLSVPDSNAANETYKMTTKGIAWSGMKDLYGETKYNLDEIVPPPNWWRRYKKGYTEENPPPNLREDEAFQNWMMLAATPNFYKLYQKNENDPMKRGQYQIDIEDNFDTTKYNGHKAFVITTLSSMGSRNIWPGIIFLIVGGICLILDIYFILSFFLWKPRKLGDPSYLSWNQPSASQGHGTS